MKFFSIILLISLAGMCQSPKQPTETTTTTPPPQTKPEVEKPAPEEALMTGYFEYMADMAIFQPCGTEEGYSITGDKAYLDLERAYLSNPDIQPPQKVYCTFKGKMADLPKMEGDGTEKGYIIEELVELDPTKRCP